MTIPDAAAIVRLVHAGEAERAARAAIDSGLRPAAILGSADYATMTNEPEPYLAFVRAWLPAAEPLDRVPLARWFLDTSVAEFAYLRVQAEAAAALDDALRAAAAELAEAWEGMAVAADNPDAGVSADGLAAARATAAGLRGAVASPRRAG